MVTTPSKKGFSSSGHRGLRTFGMPHFPLSSLVNFLGVRFVWKPVPWHLGEWESECGYLIFERGSMLYLLVLLTFKIKSSRTFLLSLILLNFKIGLLYFCTNLGHAFCTYLCMTWWRDIVPSQYKKKDMLQGTYKSFVMKYETFRINSELQSSLHAILSPGEFLSSQKLPA